jgi:hypothetical protein
VLNLASEKIRIEFQKGSEKGKLENAEQCLPKQFNINLEKELSFDFKDKCRFYLN